jgi:NADPH:quinone reductase-like Zn-dependent oxidoreductase
MWKIPEWISFEDGAGTLLALLTAWNALYQIGRVQAGETVLVHDGYEAVGQASTQVARHFEAKIFASYRTTDQKGFLMKKYNIPEDCLLKMDDEKWPLW